MRVHKAPAHRLPSSPPTFECVFVFKSGPPSFHVAASLPRSVAATPFFQRLTEWDATDIRDVPPWLCAASPDAGHDSHAAPKCLSVTCVLLYCPGLDQLCALPSALPLPPALAACSWRRAPPHRSLHSAPSDCPLAWQIRNEVRSLPRAPTGYAVSPLRIAADQPPPFLLPFSPCLPPRSFTLGCGCLVAGMAVLKGWKAQLTAMLQPDRLPFTAGERAPLPCGCLVLTLSSSVSACPCGALKNSVGGVTPLLLPLAPQGTWGAHWQRSGPRCPCTRISFPSFSQGCRRADRDRIVPRIHHCEHSIAEMLYAGSCLALVDVRLLFAPASAFRSLGRWLLLRTMWRLIYPGGWRA